MIEDLHRFLGSLLGDAVTDGRAGIINKCGGRVTDLVVASDRADSERSAKDFEVVMVDQVPDSGFTYLVEASKLVEIKGVTIGHQAAMKGYEEALLIHRIDGRDRAETTGPLWNDKRLVVVGIDIGGEHGVDGAGESSVDAVGEDGF